MLQSLLGTIYNPSLARPSYREVVQIFGTVCARCMHGANNPSREYYTRCVRGVHAVHAHCVYWDDFIDPTTYSTMKCMCFQAVKGLTIEHTALCPLTVSSMSLSWLPTGITVSQIRSNGDRVPATVISTSECGQYVSIKQSRNQGMAFSPHVVPTRYAVRTWSARSARQ